jgi:hypothetical protein
LSAAKVEIGWESAAPAMILSLCASSSTVSEFVILLPLSKTTRDLKVHSSGRRFTFVNAMSG